MNVPEGVGAPLPPSGCVFLKYEYRPPGPNQLLAFISPLASNEYRSATEPDSENDLEDYFENYFENELVDVERRFKKGFRI